MLSAILNFFLILLKFSLVLMALTLAGVLLVYLLKAVRLHAVGVGFFMAGIIAYSNASGWSDIRAPILAAALFVAWIACITKVRAVPKKYYQMKSVSNSVIIAWGALYAFGFGVFALIIPGIAQSVPLEGYDWYIYVSLAFLAVTPVILVNGHLEDIEKLGKRLHGRTEIDEMECQEMITSLLKADADRDDFDKKYEFVMEYLEMCDVKILWENEAPANTENTTAKLVDRRVSEKRLIEGNMPK